MGKTDKDLHQKQSAIRYFTVRGFVPFLEVEVENKKELSDQSTIITDIDVLGVKIESSGHASRVIFDCKTLGKASPINRSFWAAGLMKYANCDEAFVLLRKTASEAHRLSAKQLDVHLFDERQFANFAEAFSLEFKSDFCYSANVARWINQRDVYQSGGGFEKFGKFLNSEIPLETNCPRGLRRLMSALLKGSGEFDPSRAAHVSVFQHALMAFSYLMSKIVHDLKGIVDFDAERDKFEKILRYYIWGGRESYSQRQKLTELFHGVSQESTGLATELPEWDRFVELTRKLLDAPAEVFGCCFILRELSLRSVSEISEEKDMLLSDCLAKSNRTRQFILDMSRYVVKATKIPDDLDKIVMRDLSNLRLGDE